MPPARSLPMAKNTLPCEEAAENRCDYWPSQRGKGQRRSPCLLAAEDREAALPPGSGPGPSPPCQPWPPSAFLGTYLSLTAQCGLHLVSKFLGPWTRESDHWLVTGAAWPAAVGWGVPKFPPHVLIKLVKTCMHYWVGVFQLWGLPLQPFSPPGSGLEFSPPPLTR